SAWRGNSWCRNNKGEGQTSRSSQRHPWVVYRVHFLGRSSCLYPLSGAKTIDCMVRTGIVDTACADSVCPKFAIPHAEYLTLRFRQTCHHRGDKRTPACDRR